MATALLAEPAPGDRAQLVVDEGNELVQSLPVAGVERQEELGHALLGRHARGSSRLEALVRPPGAAATERPAMPATHCKTAGWAMQWRLARTMRHLGRTWRFLQYDVCADGSGGQSGIAESQVDLEARMEEIVVTKPSSRSRWLGLALAIGLVAAAPGRAAWIPDGVPVATVDNDQRAPAIVRDGAGGAIIAWWDDRPSGTGIGIYAQRLDADGNPMWTPNGILVGAVEWVTVDPVAVSDGLGGAYIVWSDSRLASPMTTSTRSGSEPMVPSSGRRAGYRSARTAAGNTIRRRSPTSARRSGSTRTASSSSSPTPASEPSRPTPSAWT